MPTVLHVAPHPDDESIGAPCTLLQLADAGHEIVVVACGLGRPADHARRRAELAAATAEAGFRLLVREPPEPVGSRDDLGAARRALSPWITDLIDGYGAIAVVGPQLHDVHPAHEAVARATRDAITAAARPPVWWTWGIWADLPVPTVLVECPDALVTRAEAMLAHHRGELARNRYLDQVRAARTLAATRGYERVAGFGATLPPGLRQAELLTELGWDGASWRFGPRRVTGRLVPPQRWGERADALVLAPGFTRPPR
ncbi:MAG: PIG-L deacetylase family protein [Pseudonocardia sp.]